MEADRARQLLSSARERIERQLARLAPEEDTELSHYDPADEDLDRDELDEGIADQLRDDLAAIERAEERLEQGKYGLSVESGEPIPDERLEAIPWAERTAEEQERYGG